MDKSSVPVGMTQTNIHHFRLAQDVIDGLVQTKNSVHGELFSEYHRGYADMYSLDLDSQQKFVLGDDVCEARIFPFHKKKNVLEALDTSRLNMQFELFVNRMFEMVKVTVHLLHVLFIRLDVFCEKVIIRFHELSATQSNVNVDVPASTPTTEVSTQQLHALQKSENKIIENKAKQITVAHSVGETYAEWYGQTGLSDTYVVVRADVEIQKSEKATNTFMQVIKILYAQLRYGATKDIDRV